MATDFLNHVITTAAAAWWLCDVTVGGSGRLSYGAEVRSVRGSLHNEQDAASEGLMGTCVNNETVKFKHETCEWNEQKPHRLIGSDRVQVGTVAIVANLRKHVRQVTAVDHKLGIHESFKVEQVSYDVNGWENIQDIIRFIEFHP